MPPQFLAPFKDGPSTSRSVFPRHSGQRRDSRETSCSKVQEHAAHLKTRFSSVLSPVFSPITIGLPFDLFDLLYEFPIVATMTALIVCRRFSASSKTLEAGDSNTSSVTSLFLTAGRQCKKMEESFPVAFMSSELT